MSQRQTENKEVMVMSKVIAALRREDDFEEALLSKVKIIFDFSINVINIEEKVKKAHSANKKIFIHMDLAEGIGKDKYGIQYVKKIGIDGVISTRTNIIKAAKEAGLCTIQRFFVLDSQSVDTVMKTLSSAKPDMIELMPGTLCKIISRISSQTDIPIIAGGLIENQNEVCEAYKSGAVAISTGKTQLWI